MPWLGDDFGMKDPQALPGLSLVQWMNMQQNSSQGNSVQPNYMNSLPGTVLPNFTGPDLSRQLGFQTPQIPMQNNIQFNAQRTTQQTQQLDQLQKLAPSSLNSLSSMMQSQQQQQHQQQMTDITQQQRQNCSSQTLPATQVQAQNLQPQNQMLQQQPSIQNHQLHRSMSQSLQQQPQHQQQIVSQTQQQNMISSQQPDQVNQQLHMSENQIQMQLLQKLHQQQQSLLAQHSGLQLPSQLSQLQDQQRQMLDSSQSYSRSTSTSQVQEIPQMITSSLPQTHVIPQEMTRNNSQTNFGFSHPSQQSKLQQQSGLLPEFSGHLGHNQPPIANHFSAGGSSLLTGAAGGGQSGITDDVPSCSTSPSTNNSPNVVPSTINNRARGSTLGDELAQSSAMLLNYGGFETFSAHANLAKDSHQKPDIKATLNMSKSPSQGFLAPQTFLNAAGTQMDYLDSSSSATSGRLSQNDVHLQNSNTLCFNSQSMPFRDSSHEEVHVDPRNNIPYEANIASQLNMSMIPDTMIGKELNGSGKDFSNNLSSDGGMLSNYENPKEAQPELSSSIVSQSFGVPDMAFNSIDSTINDSSFLNSGAWAPAPQFQRMRTYTKVYKRGAVGRSIDIARYSGYEELKRDLARRFGIEGQLEDRHRIGWKLVYVDLENDVLLVGDDPWEEFVNCVRCIKILSPQEVQQMSLDGDFGNNALSNQACSSSDGGNV